MCGAFRGVSSEVKQPAAAQPGREHRADGVRGEEQAGHQAEVLVRAWAQRGRGRLEVLQTLKAVFVSDDVTVLMECSFLESDYAYRCHWINAWVITWTS